MATKSLDMFTQIMNVLKGLGAGKLMALIFLLAATVAGIFFMAVWTSTPDFQLLYSGLAPEDAGEIINKLKENKIPYEISLNGKAILVPNEILYETRLSLANEGLPHSSGVGFEIFDQTKLGMTEFVQNVNYQRAVQGELCRTINGFDEVESSRVHIVMPSDSLFIDEQEPPTASVVLKLRHGRRLNEEQVRGIIHLVSAGVSQLEPENVTVLDNFGRLLAGPKDGSSVAQLSSDQLEYQQKAEKELEKRVETMLEKVLGSGKAIPRISCAFDFRRHEKTEEVFNPNGKVVRSEKIQNTISAASEMGAMGVPGVASNIPSEGSGTDAPSENLGGRPGYQKEDKTVNYEIGKVTTHTVDPVGRLERISVAVVVDGTHEMVKNDEGEDEKKYTPRSEEELVKIEEIVKRAVNFDAERGDEIEVVNIPFETVKLDEDKEEIVEEGWLTQLEKYRGYLRYLFMSIFLFFLFLFVVKPMVRWLTSSSSGNNEMNRQLPMTVEEIERGYGEGKSTLPYRDRAVAMLTGEDEGSLSVAREWLAEK